MTNTLRQGKPTTKRSKALDALGGSELNLRELVEGLPQLVWTCRPDGPCDYLSRQWLEYTGIPEAEQLGYGWLQQLHPDDRQRTIDTWNATIGKGADVFEIEFRIRRADGQHRWFTTRALPVRDADGRVVRWLGSNTDIEDLKRAGQAVADSELRYRLLFENLLNGYAHFRMIYEQDVAVDLEYLAVNPAFEKLTGLSGVTGRRISEVVPGIRESNPELLEIYGRVASTGHQERFEMHIAPMEMTFDVSVYCPVHGQAVAIFDNITERKRSEAALRESEERFRYFFEHSPVGKSMTFATGEVNVNLAFCEMLGYTEDEIRGRAWQELTHRDDLDLSERALAPLLSGEAQSARFVKRYLRKDGSIMWGDVATSLRRDAEGNPLYFMTSVTDITERKRAEAALQKSHDELETRVTERTAELAAANKELEAFSFSVSHDLRAPLRAIDGFSRMLLEDHAAQLDAEGQRLLGTVRDNTRAMSQLIDDLLAFSRVGRAELNPGRIAMDEVVRSAVAEVLQQAAEDHLELRVAPLPDAVGDASLIRQVWVNLLANAVKFTATRDHPLIEVFGDRDGELVRYHVRDNGVGFDMAYANKLFGVFQRLHSARDFPGTGVGLALVRRIVGRHGGTTSAVGAVNRGAEFCFTLPSADKEKP